MKVLNFTSKNNNKNLLTAEEVRVVKSSFSLLLEHSLEASDLFFKYLFQLDPSLKLLFKSEEGQKEKFFHVLENLIESIDSTEKLISHSREFGRKQPRNAIKEEHYASAGASLLTTLEVVFGEKWSQEDRDAWMSLYVLVVVNMKATA